jgi:hypothetical protein
MAKGTLRSSASSIRSNPLICSKKKSSKPNARLLRTQVAIEPLPPTRQEVHTHHRRNSCGIDPDGNIGSCADPRAPAQQGVSHPMMAQLFRQGPAAEIDSDRARSGNGIVGTWLVTYTGGLAGGGFHPVAQRRHGMGEHRLSDSGWNHLHG